MAIEPKMLSDEARLFYEQSNHGSERNSLLNPEEESLQFLFDQLKGLIRSEVENDLSKFSTLEKRLSVLVENMEKKEFLNHLVYESAKKYYKRENNSSVEEGRLSSFGFLGSTLNSVYESVKKYFGWENNPHVEEIESLRLLQRLTPNFHIALTEFLTKILEEKARGLPPKSDLMDDYSYPELCQIAIQQTYNKSNLEWAIDEMPVRLNQERFVQSENIKDDFYRCVYGLQEVEELRAKIERKECVKTNCAGYVALVLLLMNAESYYPIFRERLGRCRDKMEVLFKKRREELGGELGEELIEELSKELKEEFRKEFYLSLDQAEVVSDRSTIEPGQILIFCQKENPSYKFFHMVFSFDPQRTIGLWHYPLDPLTGKSLGGAQIMDIQYLVTVLADDQGINPEDIIIKQLSIEAFMQELQE